MSSRMPAAWLPPPAGRVAARAGLLAVAAGPPAQLVLLVLGAPDRAVDAARFGTVAAAAGLCLLRAVLLRTDRAAWTVLAAGLLAWVLNAARWLTAGGRGYRLPSVLDGLPLLFFVAAIGGLTLLLRSRWAGRRPRGLAADWAIGVLAAGAGAVAVVGPGLGATGGGVPGAIALAYVSLDLVLAGHLVVALTASGFHDPVWWALLAGLGVYLGTDAAYTVAAAMGSYGIGPLVGLGWSTGLALLGLAAWVRPVEVRQLRLRPWTLLAVPALSVGLALAVLVALGRPDPPGAVPLAAAAVAVATLRALHSLHRSFFHGAAAHEAVTDELTGLANRRLLLARLDAALAPGAGPHALVLLDLDQFKEVNDTLGHPVGDELLRRLGPRLAGTARPGETVARLGGDEFAVLVPGVGTEEAALRAAERVLSGLDGPFVVDGLTLFVAGSAGVALTTRHGADGPTLLRCADVAMYQAKRAGGGVTVYRPRAERPTRNRLAAAHELRRALAAGEIGCVYQPQVALGSGVPVAVEALPRWADGRRAADEFLGLAEQSGLMPALTRVVLATAVADLRPWREVVPGLRVVVGLGAGALLDSGLPDRVAGTLAAAGLPAGALVVKVAGTALPDRGRARTTLLRLHQDGVRIALDGFGAERAAGPLLRQLTVHELLLDGDLVGAAVTERPAREIVAHAVLLGHALDLTVAAAGVRDAAALALLGRLGCDAVQGPAVAPPLTAAAVAGWLAGSPVAHSRAGRLAP